MAMGNTTAVEFGQAAPVARIARGRVLYDPEYVGLDSLPPRGPVAGAVMIDGKMQDDATVKQCRVMVELAKMLCENDDELKSAYEF